MSSAHRHLSERQIARSLLPDAGWRGAGRAEAAKDASDAGHANDAAILCRLCAARLEEAARLSQHFDRAVLPRTLPCLHLRAGSAGGRLGARRWARWRASWRWCVPAASLAAAAALLLVLRPPRTTDGARLVSDAGPLSEASPVEAELAIKGPRDPSPARLFIRRGDGAERLDDGSVVRPGDALAFVVEPGRAGYALVVSIDGAQRISVYSPYAGAESAAVPFSILPVVLEPSIILDDALGAERIWLLLSDAPLATSEVVPALRGLAAAGTLAVQRASAEALLEGAVRGGGVTAVSWLLHKVPR